MRMSMVATMKREDGCPCERTLIVPKDEKK